MNKERILKLLGSKKMILNFDTKENSNKEDVEIKETNNLSENRNSETKEEIKEEKKEEVEKEEISNKILEKENTNSVNLQTKKEIEEKREIEEKKESETNNTIKYQDTKLIQERRKRFVNKNNESFQSSLKNLEIKRQEELEKEKKTEEVEPEEDEDEDEEEEGLIKFPVRLLKKDEVSKIEKDFIIKVNCDDIVDDSNINVLKSFLIKQSYTANDTIQLVLSKLKIKEDTKNYYLRTMNIEEGVEYLYGSTKMKQFHYINKKYVVEKMDQSIVLQIKNITKTNDKNHQVKNFYKIGNLNK
jgi:hypothetical protein